MVSLTKGEFKQNRNIWTSIFFGPSVPTRVGTRRFWPLCGHEGPKTSGDVFGPPDLFGPSLHDKRFHGRGHGRVCGCLRTVSWTRTCQDSLFMHAHASLHDYARACRRKRDCASTLARHVTSSTFSAWSSVFTNDCRVYTDTGAW